jgi:hypothetical protein
MPATPAAPAATQAGATGLAADAGGDVYLSDSLASSVYRIGGDGKPTVFLRQAKPLVRTESCTV